MGVTSPTVYHNKSTVVLIPLIIHSFHRIIIAHDSQGMGTFCRQGGQQGMVTGL